jgi:hypothetical protein
LIGKSLGENGDRVAVKTGRFEAVTSSHVCTAVTALPSVAVHVTTVATKFSLDR